MQFWDLDTTVELGSNVVAKRSVVTALGQTFCRKTKYGLFFITMLVCSAVGCFLNIRLGKLALGHARPC